jgi:uncharacterized protein YjaZ
MKFKFINTLASARIYVEAIEKGNSNFDELWEENMIKPYWSEISQWAPFDCSFMKPKPIKDIETLKKQMDIFENINFEKLAAEFTRISSELVKQDDDPIVIAFYPLEDENSTVKNLQNGVIGSNVFGNMLININTLAEDFEKWIPYVMAHEYHHSVWGHNWFVLRGDAKGNLLEYLINEGQADSFACSLYSSLEPKWLSPLTSSEDEKLWRKYSLVLNSTDRSVQERYMFGDKSLGIPWCAGYYFGYKIIKSFLKNNSDIGFDKLINIDSDKILSGSSYCKECC